VSLLLSSGVSVFTYTHLARDLDAGAVRVTCCVGGRQKSGCGAEDEREKGRRHKLRGGPKDMVSTSKAARPRAWARGFVCVFVWCLCTLDL